MNRFRSIFFTSRRIEVWKLIDYSMFLLMCGRRSSNCDYISLSFVLNWLGNRMAGEGYWPPAKFDFSAEICVVCRYGLLEWIVKIISLISICVLLVFGSKLMKSNCFVFLFQFPFLLVASYWSCCVETMIFVIVFVGLCWWNCDVSESSGEFRRLFFIF